MDSIKQIWTSSRTGVEDFFSSDKSDRNGNSCDNDPSQEIAVSRPLPVTDSSPQKRTSPEYRRGRKDAVYGLRVGAEAIMLDKVEEDYIAAYLYYCSAIKILMNALKGSFYFFFPSLSHCSFIFLLFISSF